MGLTLEGVGGTKNVRSCPVTKSSSGVMSFEPDVIAEIAGATSSKNEWLLWLLGNRSEDGYEVHVTGWYAPPQRRGGSHADLANQEQGEDVPTNLVGVIHLHPWKSDACFSTIDANELNPLYPSSIVVSPANNNLGFTYSAEGKVVLPCGSMGVVDMVVAVVGSERHKAEPMRGLYDEKYDGLGDCNRYSEEAKAYTLVDLAECGLKEERTRPAIYGCDGAAVMAAVEAATVAVVHQSTYQPGKALPPRYIGGNGNGSNGYGGAHNRPAGMSKRQWKRLMKGKYGSEIAEKLSARQGGITTQARLTSTGRGFKCDLCGETVDTVYTIDSDEVCMWCRDWLERYDQYQMATDSDAAGYVPSDEPTMADLIASDEFLDVGNGRLVRVVG